MRTTAAGAVALCAALAACGGAARTPVVEAEPSGPPRLTVVYPAAGAAVTASDSTFVFGSVVPAGLPVTVNGVPAQQAESGGWLAWVPVQPGPFTFRVVAAEAVRADSATHASLTPPGADAAPMRELSVLEVPVEVAGAFGPTWRAVLDTASVVPRDEMELHPGDPLTVGFRGVPGLHARALLGMWDETASTFEELAGAPFVETPARDRNIGRRVFGEAQGESERPAAPPSSGPDAAWYEAELLMPGPTVNGDPFRYEGYRGVREGCGEGQPNECGGWRQIAVEVTQGDSTFRYQLARAAVLVRDPAQIEVVKLDDDMQHTGRTDGRVVARTAPDGVYFLFLPNGTKARAERRIGGSLELRLAEDLSVWTDTMQITGAPKRGLEPRSLVPVVRTQTLAGWTRVIVPLERRLPLQVRQRTVPAGYDVTIFGAVAATEFVRYDGRDELIREIRWNQPANDRFVLNVDLADDDAWGFRYGYDGTDFYLDVRTPPGVDDDDGDLDGLTIVVDPGHAPDPGSTGPTGLQEKDANLAVALELARQLEEEGATVVLTRTPATPEDSLPGLNDRTNLAARVGADLLVSVHHNALPDGVNPFEHNGTAVFYYHPQSLALARAIQRELLDELELPDFGVGLGNLAVVRATEMPAVLTEAAFMMLPDQEERLRTEEFQRREATAIRRGIQRFLRERA